MTRPEVEFEEDELGAGVVRGGVTAFVGWYGVRSEAADGPSLATVVEVPAAVRALVIGVHRPLGHDFRVVCEILGQRSYSEARAVSCVLARFEHVAQSPAGSATRGVMG